MPGLGWDLPWCRWAWGGLVCGLWHGDDRRGVQRRLLLLAWVYCWSLQPGASPYFAQTLQAWEQGRFIRFLRARPVAGFGAGPTLRWCHMLVDGLGREIRKTKIQPMIDTTPQTVLPTPYFFCLNERPNGEACCAQHHAKAAFDRCKQAQVKAAGLAGPAKCG